MIAKVFIAFSSLYDLLMVKRFGYLIYFSIILYAEKLQKEHLIYKK